MPLQKLVFRPGVNRENTNYANEQGWYDCDKIRFRSGFPEKIGGWTRFSNNQYLGICRSLNNWNTLSGDSLIGVGTSVKFYLNQGGAYNDITPIYHTSTNLGAPSGPFTATNGSNIITVTDATYSPSVGDYVTFSGTTSLGGTITAAVLDAEFVVLTTPTSSTYTIQVSATANGSDTGHGGATVVAAYQVPRGNDIYTIGTGWGLDRRETAL